MFHEAVPSGSCQCFMMWAKHSFLCWSIVFSMKYLVLKYTRVFKRT